MVRTEEFKNLRFTCILQICSCFNQTSAKMKPARETPRSFLRSLRNDYTTDQESARFNSTTIQAKMVTSHSKLLLGLAAGIADVATTSHVTSSRDSS